MAVKYCHLCRQDPAASRRYGRQGLAEGIECPICYQPTCRYHLTVVRWRWRDTAEVDSTLVCRRCQRTYAHRYWDALKREWIT